MSRDMTRKTDIVSVTNDQGYDQVNRCFICHKWPGISLGKTIPYLSQITRIWLDYLMIYLSQMSRYMHMISDYLSVTHVQGCDYAIGYFICHRWQWIWLGYPILYLSQMNRDMARLTNMLPVTNDQRYDKVNQCFICHKWPGIWQV